MSKKRIIKLITGIVFMALCYLFVKWDINIGAWEAADRFMFLYCSIAIGGVIGFLCGVMDE